MLRRLKMVDRSEYGIAGAAILSAWYAGTKLAFWLLLHPWAQKLSQLLFTLALGIAAVTVQHFWRQLLRRLSPDDAPLDLFDLARRGLSRLRNAKRWRKGA
jgi:hypothetical protein